MARPKVDSRLQNIEGGIKDIKDKLCEMSPCNPQNKEKETEEET